MLRSNLPRDSRDEGGECASGEPSGSFFIRSPPYALKTSGFGAEPQVVMLMTVNDHSAYHYQFELLPVYHTCQILQI